MNYLKLTFEEIMQNKILYYDKEVESACFDICDTLKIDNMPGYDSKSYFELANKKFIEKQIVESCKLQISDRIFEENNIKKFRNNKHNVLFVFSGSILKGVVHFADYNRNIVLKRIQDDVLNFEFNLREFLVLNNIVNQDIIKFYEDSLSSERREKNKLHIERRLSFLKSKEKEMNNLGTFQLFDLSDLMDYCNSSFSGKIFKFENHDSHNNSIGNHIIGPLRNMVMHGKNPIQKDGDTSIFSIESLETFKSSLEILAYYNSKLEIEIFNNIDYQKSIKLENKSKLEIIHLHHPRALKYFIGY